MTGRAGGERGCHGDTGPRSPLLHVPTVACWEKWSCFASYGRENGGINMESKWHSVSCYALLDDVFFFLGTDAGRKVGAVMD